MTAQNTPAEPFTALHLALEALEHHTEQTRPIERTEQAIAALRQAIASEQPVVAYKVNWPVEISVGARRFYGADEWENSRKTVEFLGGEWQPLYASPQPAAQQPVAVPAARDETDSVAFRYVEQQVARDMAVFYQAFGAHSAAAPQAPSREPLTDDPLQGAADWLCQACDEPSVGLIQRQLLLGYNRSARLFEKAMSRAHGITKEGGKA